MILTEPEVNFLLQNPLFTLHVTKSKQKNKLYWGN